MKRIHWAIAVITVLLTVQFGFGNLPPSPRDSSVNSSPRLNPAPASQHLTVVVDASANVSTVTLPADLHAAADAEPSSFARIQTAVIGAMMTMAITFGGLFLIRRPQNGGVGMPIVILLGSAMIGVAAVAAFADIAPPPTSQTSELTLQQPGPKKPALDSLTVKIDRGNEKDVVLRLTPADAAKLAAGLKASIPNP